MTVWVPFAKDWLQVEQTSATEHPLHRLTLQLKVQLPLLRTYPLSQEPQTLLAEQVTQFVRLQRLQLPLKKVAPGMH